MKKSFPEVEQTLHLMTIAVGDFIHYNRKSRGLSIADLSKLSKVSIAVIVDLENARSLPKLEVLLKLARAFNVHVSTLFSQFLQGEAPSAQIYNNISPLERAIKKAGLGNIETKQVLEFIEFKKYLNNQRK